MNTIEATISTIPTYVHAIKSELSKKIHGQEELIESLLAAMFAGGHVLLTGVPGLAKSLLASSLAQIIDLKSRRIQFTPDMMPSDITGSEILELDPNTGQRFFKFMEGPVFVNLLLADEINRTPPKTQAALLEAMQERSITVSGVTRELAEPFFVIATRNPIEQAGTYPLPEAQLDRFMFALNIDYPDFDAELKMLTETTSAHDESLNKVIGIEEILRIKEAIRYVIVPNSVAEFIVNIVRGTRPNGSDSVADAYIQYGAGPRASQYLALGAKAFAAFEGRTNIDKADVLRCMPLVLEHRILLNYRAESEKINYKDIFKAIIK